jgi:hypothetical protein
MQAKFADELLVSGLALGLAGDVGEDGGVGEHRSDELRAASYELSAVGYQLSA